MTPSIVEDSNIYSFRNLILNGSFDLDSGFIGWEKTGDAEIVDLSKLERTGVNISEGLFYENAAKVGVYSNSPDSSIRYLIPVSAGTYLITFKAFMFSGTGGMCKVYKSDSKGNISGGDISGDLLRYTEDTDEAMKTVNSITNTTTKVNGHPVRFYKYFTIADSIEWVAISFETPMAANDVSNSMIVDGVMAFNLNETFGAQVTTTPENKFKDVVELIDGFIGGYWEGGFSIPKIITDPITNVEKIVGAIKVRATIRGFCSKQGRLAINFTEGNYGVPLMNKYWFTTHINEMEGIDRVMQFFTNPDENIITYAEPPTPFKPDPEMYSGGVLSDAYIGGWPRYTNPYTKQNIPLLVNNKVDIYKTEDYIGEKLVIDFYTYPARFTYAKDGLIHCRWSPVTINITPDKGLAGFGSLMVSSDYSIYIRFNTNTKQFVTSSIDATPTRTMALRFLINSWIIGDDFKSQKEDLAKEPKYFIIPVEMNDSLATIRAKILYGGETKSGYKFDPLEKQINDYFNTVAVAINSTEMDTFNVIADLEEGISVEQGYTMADVKAKKQFSNMLCVRISTTNEEIQHEMSCYAYLCDDFIVKTICNQYFINENIYELRSYYDMYGIDKPQGSTPTEEYKPLAYGFKFNLDIITEYTETESSSIDVTPIPGQSSAKAIGVDVSGAIRDITISGIRVDNSNIWTFHVPWQENGENKGVIYTGTSNWGWVKFMKAILGTFQMSSGPYRLIMMTVPSSSQMQYYPTRDGCYQYSDGTYVVLAGWEDMCYVMVENFMYSRSEDMFNAIQYTLKLKRVAPLLA